MLSVGNKVGIESGVSKLFNLTVKVVDKKNEIQCLQKSKFKKLSRDLMVRSGQGMDYLQPLFRWCNENVPKALITRDKQT